MDAEGAHSTGAGKTSAENSKRCLLRCDPAKLPKPQFEKPVVKRLCELSKETAREVLDFYTAQKTDRKIRWMKKHKKRRTHY